MSEFRESDHQPTPRQVLERILGGVAVGSPKWLRIADESALLHVSAHIDAMVREYPEPDKHMKLLAMHQAIAEGAQIRETMRNRSMGSDAAAYNAVDFDEVYAAYYTPYQHFDQQRQCVLEPETKQRIAEAIHTDMLSIIADRAIPQT